MRSKIFIFSGIFCHAHIFFNNDVLWCQRRIVNMRMNVIQPNVQQMPFHLANVRINRHSRAHAAPSLAPENVCAHKWKSHIISLKTNINIINENDDKSFSVDGERYPNNEADAMKIKSHLSSSLTIFPNADISNKYGQSLRALFGLRVFTRKCR